EAARLSREMMGFGARKFGERIHEAWQDFNMSEAPQPLEEFSEERQIFMPYFLFQWDPDVQRRGAARRLGGVVARWYMLEKSKELTSMERMFLEQATTQPLTFYEVVWSKPGESLLLRDVLIGSETEVIERSASQALRQGDLIYGQIWHEPELAVLGCSSPLTIPPDRKCRVIQLRQQLKKKIAKQNRYLTPHDLLRYQELIRATYLGIREGNRKIKSLDNTILGRIKISEGLLIADVNSENRAQQLRTEIEKRLGSMAVHESTLAQTLDDMRKSASQESAEDKELHEAKNEALLADPKAREFLQAMVQKQVEGWVHEKIPALCGRTPLEAVRDPDGREMVDALLLQWERNDERGISPDQIRPDIGAIRRLLNLPAPAA